jgi:hypothetical protein
LFVRFGFPVIGSTSVVVVVATMPPLSTIQRVGATIALMRIMLLLLGIMAKYYHSCIPFLLPRSCRVYPYGNSDCLGVGMAETR